MVKINTKLIILAILLVAIPGIILGIVGYNAAKTAVYTGIDDRLQDQSKDWRLLVQAYNDEINAQESRVRVSAQNIVTAQSKSTYELIRKSLDDNNGSLSEAQKEDLLNRISTQTVGKTGYIWILDYNGNYVLSKSRLRDGENIWNTLDSNGNYVIKDLVSKGKAAKGNEVVYHSYPWLNNGEIVPREKIAAMVHFPELGWVVGISTYYDDLVDMNYRQRTIEHVKDLMAQQIIGESGYIWVVDGNGTYVVSKNRLRDGEDISQSKDTNGVLFIQEAIRKAKAAGEGTDIQQYPWQNKDENSPRMKVAGLSYVKELDWVIGVSAYYDDFQGSNALGYVKNILIIVGIISIIAGIILAFIVANMISKPLRDMAKAGNAVSEGKLDTELPAVKTKDEVEDIGNTMNMLVGAIKYLRKDDGKAAEKDKAEPKKHSSKKS